MCKMAMLLEVIQGVWVRESLIKYWLVLASLMLGFLTEEHPVIVRVVLSRFIIRVIVDIVAVFHVIEN